MVMRYACPYPPSPAGCEVAGGGGGGYCEKRVGDY